MANFNTRITFPGSGVISTENFTIFFNDQYLTDLLPLAESGQAGLDERFVNESIVGALNQLIDGLTETSGNVNAGVSCYTEGVDSAEYVHTLTHNLNTVAVQLQMYDADPASGPVATNVITSYTPVDQNTVRVELDAPASGFFVVFGCPTP